MATTPSDEAIKAVAAKRAEAERQLAEQRRQREDLIKKLTGVPVTLVRSCNDLGHLYASVTQQEIATALGEAGYPGVRARDVRLNTHIKRVDTYEVPIKFDTDLEASVKLWVVADRKLDLEKIEEAQAAEAAAPQDGGAAAQPAAIEGKGAEAADTADKPARAEGAVKERKGKGKPEAAETASEAKTEKPKADKSAKAEKGAKAGKDEQPRGDKPEKQAKGKKTDGEEAPAAKADKSGWGKKVEMPSFVPANPRERRRRRG
jgi:large subunit ribosomal protein L9